MSAQQQPSREDYRQKFRGRFLLFLTEAWAVRKEAPSALGLTMDAHALALKQLMDEVYDYLIPPAPPSNGKANGVHRKESVQ